MEKGKKYKFRRLFIQISMIVIPLFLLTAAGIAVVVYNTTVKGFLEGQRSLMSRQLENIVDETCVETNTFSSEKIDWYFDKLEEYGSKVLSTDNEGSEDELYKFYETDTGSVSDVMNAPESVQYRLTKDFFDILYQAALKSYMNYGSKKLFIVDASEGHKGMVICDLTEGNIQHIGEPLDIDMSEHKVLEKLLDSDNSTMEAVFERSSTFPDEGKYYIAYFPIVHENRPRAIIGVVYDWNSFNEALRSTLMQTIIICVGALIIVLILLQFIIYRRATAPVSAIQQTIREYTQDKDSGRVVSAMERIKVKNELGLLSKDVSELAREIDYYTGENIKLAAEKERVTAELDMARKIQADQLPGVFPAFPEHSEFDIYASMTPAKEVGGDFYDFFFADEDHLVLVIADVSGKGVPAALFMMKSMNLIKDHAMMGLSPREITERVNRMLCRNNKQEMFVTAWIGILELSTGRVTAVNAGHEFPAIQYPDGKFELFDDDHCFVLGGLERAPYRQYSFTLPKGGTLFVYTDGVTEATNAEDVMFGEERLVGALNKTEASSVRELLESVHAEIDRFVGDAPQYDDLTMLGIKLL